LKIGFDNYSWESFIETILSLDLERYERLKVACFMTYFDQWRGDKIPNLEDLLLRGGFRIEKMGDIRRLSCNYFDTETKQNKLADMYAYLNPETKLLLCFTSEKTEAIDQTIGNFANISPGIYYMFISSRIFDSIRAHIVDEFPGTRCIYFTAKHIPQFAKRGETRPDIDRTIMYHGEDALQTLEEVQQYYGVSPRVMRYRIPSLGIYEIKNSGYFTLRNTDEPVPAKKFLLSLVEFASVQVLRSKQIIEKSDFKLIPLKTEQKVFEIPKLVPWVIRFGKPLSFEDAESLVESMAKNGYTVFNYVMAKGSLRLNGMVLDEKKNSLFTIDADGEHMIVAPKEKISFDAFLRFFATIVDYFDPAATVEEVQ